jgi:hypothetical protein
MTKQAFDILCPTCGSVVPHEASGCPNCAAGRKQEPAPAASVPAPAAPKAPDVGGMALKDYHRFVRKNYRTVEGPRVAGYTGGGSSAFKTYFPLAFLMLLLIVGAAVAFGHL